MNRFSKLFLKFIKCLFEVQTHRIVAEKFNSTFTHYIFEFCKDKYFLMTDFQII